MLRLPQSLSMTPSNPQCFRRTVFDIQPFAQLGVPLIASYAHMALRPVTLAVSMIWSGTM